MSLTEVLEELPKLSEQERLTLRDRLDDMAGDDWQDDGLTEDDKRRLLERIERARQDPSSLVPWEEAKARMQARLGAW